MPVEPWGAGRPDFYQDVLSSKPILIKTEETQAQWKIQKEYTIAAQSVTVDTLYTVEAGYDLNLEVGIISVRDSCINQINLFGASSTLTGDFRFDMRGDLTSAIAGQVIGTGEPIIAHIYNNDTITSNFSLTLTGMRNRI